MRKSKSMKTFPYWRREANVNRIFGPTMIQWGRIWPAEWTADTLQISHRVTSAENSSRSREGQIRDWRTDQPPLAKQRGNADKTNYFEFFSSRTYINAQSTLDLTMP